MDPTSGWMKLQITEKRLIAKGTYWFVLEHPEGEALPKFEAGAHVTLKMPNGLNRQYSLCGDPENTRRYEIAVKREDTGRGGSLSLADDTKVGDWMDVSLPIHAFALEAKAKSFLLIAGGIGITPMRSMLMQLQSESMRKFKLIYLTRDAESTAFLDELTSNAWTGQVQLHHDQGDADPRHPLHVRNPRRPRTVQQQADQDRTHGTPSRVSTVRRATRPTHPGDGQGACTGIAVGTGGSSVRCAGRSRTARPCAPAPGPERPMRRARTTPRSGAPGGRQGSNAVRR